MAVIRETIKHVRHNGALEPLTQKVPSHSLMNLDIQTQTGCCARFSKGAIWQQRMHGGGDSGPVARVNNQVAAADIMSVTLSPCANIRADVQETMDDPDGN